MTELARQCLSLSNAERLEIVKILQESLKQDMVDWGRLAFLLKCAEEAVGCNIATKKRDYLPNIGRRMFAYQARKEGYSLETIGKRIARNHSSVIHMKMMQEDVFRFPASFKVEMAYWEKFKKKIDNYDIHNRTTQES